MVRSGGLLDRESAKAELRRLQHESNAVQNSVQRGPQNDEELAAVVQAEREHPLGLVLLPPFTRDPLPWHNRHGAGR